MSYQFIKNLASTHHSPPRPPLSSRPPFSCKCSPVWWNGALINGSFKIIIGAQSYAFWQSPIYPNASTDHTTEEVYGGCV